MRVPRYSVGPGPGEYTLATPIKGRLIVEISPHAERRMKARGISVAEVLMTIRSPHETGLPTRAGRDRVRSGMMSSYTTSTEAVRFRWRRIGVITAITITRT